MWLGKKGGGMCSQSVMPKSKERKKIKNEAFILNIFQVIMKMLY